jgi:hypothetical protein
MKVETSTQGLRITGKAWEIRHKLQQISSPKKLQEWLQERTPIPPTFTVLSGGLAKKEQSTLRSFRP